MGESVKNHPKESATPSVEYATPAIAWEETLDVQTLSIACNKSTGEQDCLFNPPVSS
jgi:hypothetical protein